MSKRVAELHVYPDDSLFAGAPIIVMPHLPQVGAG